MHLTHKELAGYNTIIKYIAKHVVIIMTISNVLNLHLDHSFEVAMSITQPLPGNQTLSRCDVSIKSISYFKAHCELPSYVAIASTRIMSGVCIPSVIPCVYAGLG